MTGNVKWQREISKKAKPFFQDDFWKHLIQLTVYGF